MKDIFYGRHDIYSKGKAEWRDVFRNLYVTSLSPRVLWTTVFQTIIGLVFLALLLFTGISCALLLLYFISGLDLLDFKSAYEPPSADDIFEALFVSLFFWLVSALYLGAVKRRLFSRLYVLAGRPLASAEGAPDFDVVDFDRFLGFKVGGRYFNFQDDCWLTEADLEKLQQAGGVMRVWYVPSTGILVRAEWRPA